MASSGRRHGQPSGGAGGSSGDSIETADWPVDELVPGMMVGEYKIDGLLGEGGMGRVYSAVHPVIAKRAAIKVLHPEMSANQDMVQRFVQEARSVNQIGHPNIVDIFSFGTLPDGRNYFVMECLRGESLRDRIDRERLVIEDAIPIVETVALALEAAHDKGIVHRDLKPDNVFLVEAKGQPPQVKLLDFGIAKLLGSDKKLRTETGYMMGTPGYMSPEQARAEAIDHRTDIYALGAMMFEMLTGSLVFPANNAADMVAMHLHRAPPSVRTLEPRVPPHIDQLITLMLAKASAARPTLPEIRRELRTPIGAAPTIKGNLAIMAATHGYESTSDFVQPSRRSRTPMIALGVAALVATVLVGVILAKQASRDTAKSEGAPTEPSAVTATPIEPTPPTPTPDPTIAQPPVPPMAAGATHDARPEAADAPPQTTEPKPTEPQTTEPKPTEPQTTEPKTAVMKRKTTRSTTSSKSSRPKGKRGSPTKTPTKSTTSKPSSKTDDDDDDAPL